MAANILAMDPTTGARAADPPLELHSMGSDGFGSAPAGYLPFDQFATKWSLQGHAELQKAHGNSLSWWAASRADVDTPRLYAGYGGKLIVVMWYLTGFTSLKVMKHATISFI